MLAYVKFSPRRSCKPVERIVDAYVAPTHDVCAPAAFLCGPGSLLTDAAEDGPGYLGLDGVVAPEVDDLTVWLANVLWEGLRVSQPVSLRAQAA